MPCSSSLVDAFLGALHSDARPWFEEDETLAATLARLHAGALAAYPSLSVGAATFAAELGRRLGAAARPVQLGCIRADHVCLAIACVAGDSLAIRCFEAEFLSEVDKTAERLRVRSEQVDDVRGQLCQILFVSEPGRPAALREFSGRGHLRTYLRVIATRELLRAMGKRRREVGPVTEDLVEVTTPDPLIHYMRMHYGAAVGAAMRIALAALSTESRALLRYSLLDGWTMDRIAALHGIHRATAARRVAAARDELGASMRAELAARLAISIAEVDSIVRMVQSGIDVSLDGLLA
jgi:RNA polymerase sigma-70 factor (ECF subfamily)